MTDWHHNDLFADATPLGLFLANSPQTAGTTELGTLQTGALEGPLDCGLVMDSHVAVSDDPAVPSAPFDEFPRLSAMSQEALDVALATAARSHALHGSDLPVTMTALPDGGTDQLHRLVSALRSATTTIAVLQPVSADETFIIRLVPIGSSPDNPAPVALLAAAVVDEASDHVGLSYLRVAHLDRAADQAARMVERRGTVTANSWVRDSSRWLPSTDETLADPEAASTFVRSLG